MLADSLKLSAARQAGESPSGTLSWGSGCIMSQKPMHAHAHARAHLPGPQPTRSVSLAETQTYAAAGRLRAAVEECLGELAMGGCRFDVRISWEPASLVRSSWREVCCCPGLVNCAGCGLVNRNLQTNQPTNKPTPTAQGTPPARCLQVGEAEAMSLGQARGGGYKLRAQVRGVVRSWSGR